MFRTIIIMILLIPFTIISLPFVGIGFIIGKFNEKLRFRIARRIALVASTILYKVSGAKITVIGLENIPKDIDSMLFVGNHRAYIDIPLLIKYIPFPIAFIAKKSLKKAYFLNLIMDLLGCLYLDRENVRQAFEVIMQGIKRLEDGNSLVIFPEGTRSKDDSFLPFKQGSLKLAEKSHVPVLPFALKGTNDVFGKHGFSIKPNKVWLTFGEPIYLDKLPPEYAKKSATYVQDIVKSLYDAMI